MNFKDFENSKLRSRDGVRFSRSTTQPPRTTNYRSQNFVPPDMKPSAAKIIYDRQYSTNWQSYVNEKKGKDVRRSYDTTTKYSAIRAMN